MALSLSHDAYLLINSGSFHVAEKDKKTVLAQPGQNATFQVSNTATLSKYYSNEKPETSESFSGTVTNTNGAVGEAFLSISSAAISLDALYNQFLLTSEQCGAVSTFLGVTRCYEPTSQGCGGDDAVGLDSSLATHKPVVFLEYEAYSTLALKVLVKLTDLIFHSFDAIHKVVIVHRIGKVWQREPGLFIGIASAHRRAALDAVSFAIEYVKKHLPVWKREVKYAATNTDGQQRIGTSKEDENFTSQWKHNAEPVIHIP